MSDPHFSVSPGHRFRDHLVITKHQPQELSLTQDGKPTIGASLVRPYPEARVLFVDHVGQMFYVYWIDHRLLAPRVES